MEDKSFLDDIANLSKQDMSDFGDDELARELLATPGLSSSSCPLWDHSTGACIDVADYASVMRSVFRRRLAMLFGPEAMTIGPTKCVLNRLGENWSQLCARLR